MNTSPVTYNDEETILEGFVASSTDKKRPLVILCHAWTGRDEFICDKAEAVAEWGYVGFALDMYGKGVLGTSQEENANLKRPFVENRNLLQKRLLRAFHTATALPFVDKNSIAVVGFGFGGMCALDFARSGVGLKGVVAISGHFEPPVNVLLSPISAKILLLHGYNDPIVPYTELLAFGNELSETRVDWQACLYSNTMHAFTNPLANNPASGIFYNPLSSERAWHSVKQFFEETLGNSGSRT